MRFERMQKTIAGAVILLCSGCSYQYGSVRGKPGESVKDVQLVASTCKYQADNHTGAGGAEWIPFAGYSVSKGMRREEFRKCVEERGYTFIPPKD